MGFRRRSLLGCIATATVPLTSGCFSLNADQSNGTTESNSSGGQGAADVFVHNLYEKTITVSIQAENMESDRKQAEKIPIDSTVELESTETHRFSKKTWFDSEYRVSVSVENGHSGEADWTPDSSGGLHVVYDGSEKLIFADGIDGI